MSNDRDLEMFDKLWARGQELLKEAGLWDDFLEWQKKHGIQAKSQEPEWEVRLKAFDNDVMDFNFVIDTFVRTSPDQAKALKEAISELVEFVLERGTEDVEVGNNFDLVDAIDKARTLITKGKE